MTLNSPALILFAKNPRTGRVKTRMQPPCSPEQAAELAEILIEETVNVAVANWPGEIELCTWPDATHPLFERLQEENSITLTSQGAGELGSKMLQAMSRTGFPCAVMGCDIPHCRPDMYLSAFNALKQGKNVIGPARDGGYFFIGLQKAYPDIFEGIHWGGDGVLDDTLDRAALMGLDMVSLHPLNDIDTFSDLLQIAAGYPRFAQWLEKQDF